MPLVYDITVRTPPPARTHIMGFANLDDEAAQKVLAYFKGWENLPEPISRRAKKTKAKPQKVTT